MSIFKQLSLMSTLLFSFVLNSTAMEVTFFNVGQGNGTLTTYPNKPSLLLDLGSSQYPADEENQSQKNSIIDRVFERIEKSGNKELALITSHPDIDHCNFICKVAQKCLEKKYTLTVLLGGSREDYKTKKKDNFDKEFKNLEDACLEKKFTFKYCDEIKNIKKFCTDYLPSYCKILAAQTGNTNPNDDSIIVRVAQNDFSVLFLGDATEKVTRDLEAKDLQSEVMLISHHGAEREKCTTESLLKKVNPKYMILSAGMRGNYHHPCHPPIQRMVKLINNNSDAAEVSPHCINFYFGNTPLPSNDQKSDEMKPIIQYEGGFATGLTSHPIYNTTNEGDITISQDRIKRSHASTAANKTEAQTALKAVTRSYKFLNKNYNFDTIIRLNLTRLGLTDDALHSFEPLPTGLIHCDLSGNNFTTTGIITIAKLLAQHKHPTQISLATKYLKTEKEKDPILKNLVETKIGKNNIPHRTLHCLERLKDKSNALITQATIWWQKQKEKNE